MASSEALFIRNPFDSRLIQEFDPRVLAARASKYNADNPSWDMVMGGAFEAEYWNAMELELDPLYTAIFKLGLMFVELLPCESFRLPGLSNANIGQMASPTSTKLAL